MATGLQRRFTNGPVSKEILINVYLLSTKEIVFTGNINQVSFFCGIPVYHVARYYISKCRVKKTWALRLAKPKAQNPPVFPADK